MSYTREMLFALLLEFKHGLLFPHVSIKSELYGKSTYSNPLHL